MWQLIVAEDPSVQLYDYQVTAACNHSIDIIESANKYAIDPFILSAIVYNESRWTKDIKNNLQILKALLNNNLKFVNLNKKIKLSAVYQIINNKGLKQQKWALNNHTKIVFVLPL